MKNINKTKEIENKDTILRDSSNAIKQLLKYSWLVFLYIAVIRYPLMVLVAPKNESTNEWAFTTAPLVCFLVFLPSFILYLNIVIKYIESVRKYRFIIYPIVYIIFFILVHVGLMSLNPILLWFWIITFPLWFLWGLIVEIIAIINDVEDWKNEKNIIEKNIKLKK